jgi:hypothetical protein
MIKKYFSIIILNVILISNCIAQTASPILPWRYRAGVNLNGLRTRTLEISGQALKGGKFIYNANLGFTYQTPRNGVQTKAQKAIDSLSLKIKSSGFFVKTGVQANLFTIADKFTKADFFIGTGFTNTWYNRKTIYKSVKKTTVGEQTGSYTGSNFAPYVSFGGNLRILYNVYLDLGVQYNLTKAQTSDILTPARYDYIPGMGGNYKNGNKATFLFMVRYEFD